jgi:5-methylcytosine-specific restriction endonuclease McrA
MSVSELAMLRARCKERGVELVERANGHYTLRAEYTINYYPNSKRRSAYVAGTTRGHHHVTVNQAVAMALGNNMDTKALPHGKRARNQRGRRRRAWNSGKRACYWCGLPFDDFEQTTLEHRIPLSRGGLDNANNHELAHKVCNSAHGNSLPHVTKRRLEREPTETEIENASSALAVAIAEHGTLDELENDR